MHWYCDQKSSAAATAVPTFPVEPSPVVRGRPPPTWFKVERSVYEKKSSFQAFTVEAEFGKYASGETSSEETDILQFWEASFLSFNGAIAYS